MVIAWSKAVAARVQKSGGIPEMFRGWNEQVLMRLRGRGGGAEGEESRILSRSQAQGIEWTVMSFTCRK